MGEARHVEGEAAQVAVVLVGTPRSSETDRTAHSFQGGVSVVEDVANPECPREPIFIQCHRTNKLTHAGFVQTAMSSRCTYHRHGSPDSSDTQACSVQPQQ
jgi:hypothetical protein